MDNSFHKKDLTMCIILTIVTCGIYSIVWLYQIGSSLYQLNNEPDKASTDMLLGFVTCGIYFLVTYYKYGKLASQYREKQGLSPSDNSTLYLVLGILGVSIANLIIMQLEINNDF